MRFLSIRYFAFLSLLLAFATISDVVAQGGKLSAEKLVFSAPIGPNYYWHLLSMANISYSSDYTRKFKGTLPEKDIKTLREKSADLSFNNNMNGQLTFPFIILPTYLGLSDEKEINEYYDLLAASYANYNFEPLLNKYDKIDWSDIYLAPNKSFFSKSSSELKSMYDAKQIESVKKLTSIFKSNFPFYRDSVWTKVKDTLAKRSAELSAMFLKANIVSQWEKLTQLVLSTDKFEVMLCYASQNGPDGIKIASDKNLFYAWGNENYLRDNVSHRIGKQIMSGFQISLKALRDANPLKYSNCIESLTYFFNKKILGKSKLSYELDIFDDFIYFNYFDKKYKTGFKVEDMITETLDEYK